MMNWYHIKPRSQGCRGHGMCSKFIADGQDRVNIDRMQGEGGAMPRGDAITTNLILRHRETILVWILRKWAKETKGMVLSFNGSYQ